MKIYKEKQYLVFDFENGKTVRYDFAKKAAIGIKGQTVRDLKSQLSGITINDVINCCTDQNYAGFLRFVMQKYSDKSSRVIKNIGTVLSHVPDYSNIEQLFSAGITNIQSGFKYKINDIPLGLIKICRKYVNEGLALTNNLVNFYKQNPDGFNVAFTLPFITLTVTDLYYIFTDCSGRWRNGSYTYYNYFNNLIDSYGYSAKSLLLYLDHLKAFEAMDGMTELLRELTDYCRIMSVISDKYDKYPKHFLTTHRIATRNYNRLKKDFDNKAFSKQIKLDMEYTYKDYRFIYPKSVDEIKDEAVQQNNCVASYIDDVIDGNCDILFMRNAGTPEKSLVTIEVKNNSICQARQHYNYLCTPSQIEAIEAWNSWYKNKIKHAS